MSEAYIGEIRMFGGNFAIKNWAMCNGQLVAISANTALFSIIGTTYGGNGVNNFALPNFQSRLPVHQGQGSGLTPYVLGEQTGNETVTLLQTQMPIHTHAYTPQANNAGGGGSRPSGGYLANSGSISLYATTTDGTHMGVQTIGNSGGSQPFSIIQPVLCVTFLICLYGLFPSRN